ncbi:MAG: hypothetical protein ABIQ16_17215 [Polyangiaceae bacterium]
MRPLITATQTLRVEDVREPHVSEQLDRELRELISSCFPRNAFFRERRCAQALLAARYKPLTERAWPEGLVDLRGPMF